MLKQRVGNWWAKISQNWWEAGEIHKRIEERRVEDLKKYNQWGQWK